MRGIKKFLPFELCFLFCSYLVGLFTIFMLDFNLLIIVCQRVPNFIGGRLVNSQSFASIDVINPVSLVPLKDHLDLCIQSYLVNNYQVICYDYAIQTWQATQQVVSQVPLTTNEEFRAAVFAAKRAFPQWRDTPITTRQRIMFKFQELIRRDIVNFWIYKLLACISVQLMWITTFLQDKLAMSITTEHGKTLKDAHGDVLRGLG
jgi:malonate-semialdehyde dehydrogenase (acetylating)/methylmalonate-semialdehyde dehydrogenase